jgi:hypothetical protein
MKTPKLWAALLQQHAEPLKGIPFPQHMDITTYPRKGLAPH